MQNNSGNRIFVWLAGVAGDFDVLKTMERKAGRPSLANFVTAQNVVINFQPASAPVPAGYAADTGEAFGSRADGAAYGWSSDNTAQTRQRGQGGVPDTFCHFLAQQKWESAVPAGRYSIRVLLGDASFPSQNTINIEGVNLCRDLSLSSGTKVFTGEVEVKDGRLTVDCGDSPERMTKIAAIEITAQ